MEELLNEGLLYWLFVLAIVIGGVVGLHYFLSVRRYYLLAKKIPAPPGLPIIGHTLYFFKGIEDVFHNVCKKMSNSEVCKLWLGTRLFVFIKNPADIELVLGSQTHLCKSVESELLEPLLGDGINIVSGCKWKAYRQLIAPLLQLKQFFGPILKYNSDMWEKTLLKNIGEDIDCYNFIRDAVMELLLVSIFGENNNTEESKEYSLAIQKLSKIIRNRQNKFWLHPDTIFNLTRDAKLQKDLLKIVSRFTRQAVRRRKEELIKQGYRRPENNCISENQNSDIQNNNNTTTGLREASRNLSILDLMMEISHDDITLMDSEIQNQVDALMLEGYNTTALIGSHLLHVLASRPDIQEKCVTELFEIFGYSDRPMTFEDTFQMKYLERCLMETLRMYPPIAFIARKLQQELRLASIGLTIPASSTVVIDVKKLHKNAEIYSRPDLFDPDNFLLKNCVSRHYFSYIPFSAGPRSCIGKKYSMISLKLLLSSILRKYKILPSSNQEKAMNKPINLKPTDGFVIKLVQRK